MWGRLLTGEAGKTRRDKTAVVEVWYNDRGDQFHCSLSGKILPDRANLTLFPSQTAYLNDQADLSLSLEINSASKPLFLTLQVNPDFNSCKNINFLRSTLASKPRQCTYLLCHCVEERERDRQTDRHRDRERHRERENTHLNPQKQKPNKIDKWITDGSWTHSDHQSHKLPKANLSPLFSRSLSSAATLVRPAPGDWIKPPLRIVNLMLLPFLYPGAICPSQSER